MVKLENCARSCNVTLQRYIKDLFLRKWIQTGHSDLIQKTRWIWTYKKSTPQQIFFKTIQSYFRTAYPNQLFLCVTKNTVPKELLIQENILDMSGFGFGFVLFWSLKKKCLFKIKKIIHCIMSGNNLLLFFVIPPSFHRKN